MTEETMVQLNELTELEPDTLTPIKWKDSSLRVLLKKQANGQSLPCFVLRDVLDALDISSADDVLKKLRLFDEGHGGEITVQEKRADGIQTTKTHQLVTEVGFYMVVFDSRKPAAVEFSRWVYAEVLPALRKKGYYSLSDSPETDATFFEELNTVVAVLKDLESQIQRTNSRMHSMEDSLLSYSRRNHDESMQKIADVANVVFSGSHPEATVVATGSVKKKKAKKVKIVPWTPEEEKFTKMYDCQLNGILLRPVRVLQTAMSRFQMLAGYDPTGKEEPLAEHTKKWSAKPKWQVIAFLKDSYPDLYPSGLDVWIRGLADCIAWSNCTLIHSDLWDDIVAGNLSDGAIKQRLLEGNHVPTEEGAALFLTYSAQFRSTN